MDSSRRASLLLRRERFEGVEYSVGARIDADRRQVAPADRALWIDHEQRSLRDAVLLPISAILPCDRALRLEIRQQRKVQLAVVRECRMAPRSIDRYTDNRCLELVELGQHFIVK